MVFGQACVVRAWVRPCEGGLPCKTSWFFMRYVIEQVMSIHRKRLSPLDQAALCVSSCAGNASQEGKQRQTALIVLVDECEGDHAISAS